MPKKTPTYTQETVARAALGIPWEDTEAAARCIARWAAEQLAALHSALAEARGHLDYCTYGWTCWENECAEARKLPTTIEEALERINQCQ